MKDLLKNNFNDYSIIILIITNYNIHDYLMNKHFLKMKMLGIMLGIKKQKELQINVTPSFSEPLIGIEPMTY